MAHPKKVPPAFGRSPLNHNPPCLPMGTRLKIEFLEMAHPREATSTSGLPPLNPDPPRLPMGTR
jgi:hypothetical protein